MRPVSASEQVAIVEGPVKRNARLHGRIRYDARTIRCVDIGQDRRETSPMNISDAASGRPGDSRRPLAVLPQYRDCKTADVPRTICAVPLLPHMPDPAPTARDDQSRRYEEAVAAFGPALDRLAVAYERDADRRKDLLQDMHFALWRSLATFDGRCALRTWVYRVAHNVAASHALRDHRRARECVGLDALERASLAFDEDTVSARVAEQLDDDRRRAQLAALIAQLVAPDRQLLLLYLEELDAVAIGEVMGLSPANVATKIHRLKRVLARRALAEDVPAPSHAPPVVAPTAATFPSAPR